MRPDQRNHSCLYSDDLGKTWEFSKIMPSGYRSKVLYDSSNKTVYCGGSNGIDRSKDFGKTWEKINDLHCYNMVLMGNYLVVSSKGGRIELIKRTN